MLRGALFLLCIIVQISANAADVMQFGVQNQRSILLTAQLWNPILKYVSSKSGVPLTLKMGKTAKATMTMAEQGQFDFIYSNLLFIPAREKLGYHPIVRFNTPGIRALIVVRDNSPYQKITDLNLLRVAFPTPDGFAGYSLQMDAFLQAGVKVEPVFTGNQESAMARLQFGHVVAAGVNNVLLENYAKRESFKYRVLYRSALYQDLPIMVNPRVPAVQVNKVRMAFLGMNKDDAGRKILQAASNLLQSQQTLGFIPATDSDYDNYRQFYRVTLVNK